MDTKRMHVHITGKVQGVWFRESTKRAAEPLGVQGWVRNLVDGRVEGIFEGPAAAVDRLVQWCHQGPPSARVEGVAAVEEEPTGEFSAFRVLH